MLVGSAVTFAQQAQAPRSYARVNCVKVRDGKGPEYTAYLRDVALKLTKVRMEAAGSTMTAYSIAQAVSPAGRSARCDYQLVTTYNAFPPEPAGPEQTGADMKKAGITMTREAMLTKRDELTYLVGTDTWVYQASVGMPAKGGYVRVNYDKVKIGKMADWVRAQSEGWIPLAELAAKEYGTAWRAATLMMPAGEALPYNAMAVDYFPTWEALGKGIPARELWNKVHPNRDMTAHMDAQCAIRDRPRVDVMRLIEVLRK
jgi:hypothetical protein